MEVEPRTKENKTNEGTVMIVFQERKHYSKKEPIIKSGVSQGLKVLYFAMINLNVTLKLYFKRVKSKDRKRYKSKDRKIFMEFLQFPG